MGYLQPHGDSLEQIKENPILSQLVLNGYIDKILILDSKRDVHLVYEKQNQRKAV